ncbi:hypothetical protein DL771_005173 [Monosporascus sp. 5C6A]|nr:hypothetical protein DL771_005173 [Monosporascus sp. 5C6A]
MSAVVAIAIVTCRRNIVTTGVPMVVLALRQRHEEKLRGAAGIEARSRSAGAGARRTAAEGGFECESWPPSRNSGTVEKAGEDVAGAGTPAN